MKSKRFTRLLGTGAALALLAGVASTELSANIITMNGYNGGGNTVSCSPDCFGFVGSTVISLSNSMADEYPKAGNPDAERDLLNELLADFDPARAPVTFVNSTDGSGFGFTTSLQFFSIKKSTEIFFFENTSGGSIAVELDGETANYSHWAEYGSAPSAVPVPAALWLFGSALIGMIGFGKRKKAA